jgi:hypothetical protein
MNGLLQLIITKKEKLSIDLNAIIVPAVVA